MKKIAFAIFLPLAAFYILSWMSKPAKKKNKKKFLVTGSIMQTASYCGGAQPTQEMIKKLRTPSGIPFGKLFVKKTLVNEEGARIIDTIRADANGNFSITLPAGNYCLVEEWKSKPFKLPLNSKMQTVDAACYRKLYNTCDYQLNITEDMPDLKFNFHRPCYFNLPCISYKGPMPHVSAPHKNSSR